MRIVSLISAGTEMLYELGLGDQVVAVSHECDWPPECQKLPRVTRSRVDSRASSRAIDEEVRRLLAEGAALYEVDMQALAQLQPDLIVTQAQCDVCAVRYQDVIAAVKKEPTLERCRVIALNPRSLEEVLNEMIQIGQAVGIECQAHEIVAKLRARITEVCRASANNAERPRVAIIEWTDPIMLAGNWTPELIELVGGRCELTPATLPSRTVTWDELVAFDPEVIVVCPCGFDQHRAEAETRLLAQCKQWNQLTAVQRGRVHPIDGNAYFNRPGPRLVNSLELLARICLQSA